MKMMMEDCPSVSYSELAVSLKRRMGFNKEFNNSLTFVCYEFSQVMNLTRFEKVVSIYETPQLRIILVLLSVH